MFVLLFSPRVVPGFIYKNRTTATPSGPVIIIGKCSQRQGSGTGQHVRGKTTVRPFNCQVHQYNLFNFSSTLPNKFHQINFFSRRKMTIVCPCANSAQVNLLFLVYFLLRYFFFPSTMCFLVFILKLVLSFLFTGYDVLLSGNSKAEIPNIANVSDITVAFWVFVKSLSFIVTENSTTGEDTISMTPSFSVSILG